MGKERGSLPVQKLSRRELLRKFGWAGVGAATIILIPPVALKVLEKTGVLKSETNSLLERLVNLRCDIRVTEDFDPRYDINISEVKRLLEDNGVKCPYWVNIKLNPEIFWRKKKEGGIQFSAGQASCFADSCLAKISTTDMGEDTKKHDLSVLETLEGIEIPNWRSAHECAHMIRYFKGLPYEGPEAELDCDQFANENYNKYQIVVEEGK